jgi:hypothetical protein
MTSLARGLEAYHFVHSHPQKLFLSKLTFNIVEFQSKAVLFRSFPSEALFITVFSRSIIKAEFDYKLTRKWHRLRPLLLLPALTCLSVHLQQWAPMTSETHPIRFMLDSKVYFS